MASVLIRGLTRGYHPHSIALQKFYSTRPSQKPSSSDDGTSRPSPIEKPASISNEETSKRQQPPPLPSQTIGKTEQTLTNLKAKIEESHRKAENVRDDIRGYALDRFINYMKNYDKVLEMKFPGAMRVYRVFMDGVKYFGRDTMDYVKIRSQMAVRGRDIDTFSTRELELFYQMPNDIRKVGPIILLSAVPFAHYITMPIAYMYPRYFLTHHFWSLQQRSEFAVMNLRDRLAYNRAVLRDLQSKLSTLKNDRHYEQWRDILGKLGSGQHPSAIDIINIKDLFSEPPYKTSSLSYTHVKHLAGLHGIRAFFTKKSKLTDRAMCLHHIDMAIKREGGASNVATEILRDACFKRGLNASNLTNEELSQFLDDWITVSEHINPINFSLFLHLPILLTYNHPNNWKLIYQDR